MKITGEATLVAPVDQVWDALLDPQVLVATIPGCERLVQTGENAYEMTVTAGVATVRGTYTGTCELFDLAPHESMTMRARGAGAPGTIDATVQVRFDANGDGTTTLLYDADAVVGGMVGGVGQRMLTSVSRRMATEFFTGVERAISGHAAHEEPVGAPVPAPGEAAGEQAAQPAVFTAPPRPVAALDQDSFLKGVAVGAGLVLVGVVVGGVFGRRR
ncbi:MAG TPA: carbon monoxide dehydrogenase subunit G [Marmoricola sp.]